MAPSMTTIIFVVHIGNLWNVYIDDFFGRFSQIFLVVSTPNLDGFKRFLRICFYIKFYFREINDIEYALVILKYNYNMNI